MKLDAGEIKDLVNETERKRQNWAMWADEWERLWRLCDFNDSPKNHKEMDGVRSVTMPDPYNVILLLQRFVAHEMRIEVPAISDKKSHADRSQEIVDWLVTFDVLSNRQQGCNHINDMVWQSGVLGRGAAQVLWIGDVIPQGTSTDKILPIWRRTLDPRNVGVGRGPYWTDYAYHKYKTTRADIQQRYPKYKLPELGGHVKQGYFNEKHTVIDWWVRHKGAIRHSVVIDDKFAKDEVTDYPDIPIIEWYGDGAPVADDLGRSLGILHPIREAYQTKNDMVSIMLTGMEYTYNPTLVAKLKTPDGKQFKAGPGEIIFLYPDEDVTSLRQDPNVGQGQAMVAMLQTGIDQSTFPGVAYGDAPGGVQAGFALNSLAQQAQARANPIRQNVEAAVEAENQIILALIEAFAPEDGVQIYQRNSKGTNGRALLLNKKVIGSNYDNQVRLLPERPLDDTQKIMAWSGLAEKRLISDSFFRDEGLNVQMPVDEEERIALENALKTPEMQLKVQLRAIQSSYDQDDWELMIVGTPLEQLHQQEQQWRERKKAEEEQAKEARRLEKQQREMEAQMANMPPLPMMPPGTMPPMPQDTLPINGMPPMGIPGQGGLSAPDQMGFSSGGPMQPPGLPGIPPQAQAQFTPDMMGLGPDAPPGMFQEMMGQPPLSDEEMMQRMGALPPGM